MTTQGQGSASQTKTVTSRKINIVPSKGERRTISFEGTTWKELKTLLSRGGKDINGKDFSPYNLRNMKPVESFKKHTLEHDEAVIPEVDFNLFLMPYKSKSGATKREAVYGKIKSFIKKDGDKAAKHFNADGKSYTRLTTERLHELLETYSPGEKKKSKDEKAEELFEVIKSVKQFKDKELVKELQGFTDSEKLDLIIMWMVGDERTATQIKEVMATESPEDLKAKQEEEEKAKKDKEEKDKKDKEAEEQRKAKEQEDRLLHNDLVALSRGFDDVSI